MSTQTRTSLLAIPVFVFCVMASVVAQTTETVPATLAWKFHAGQRFDQVLEQNTKATMKLAGQEIQTNTKLTIDAVLAVKGIDDQGVAEIEQQFNRVRMKLATPSGMGFEFDSEKNEELTGVGATLAPALKELAKAALTLKMTPQGGIESMRLSMQTDEAIKSIPAAAQMGGVFSKDGLFNMVGQGTYKFPAGPLRRGATWTDDNETKVPRLGSMKTSSKLTYAGTVEVEGKQLEKIQVEVTASVERGEEAPAQIKLKEQKAKGSILFNNAVGHLSRSELVQSMTMEVHLVGTNAEQQIDQTVSVRLTPANK